MLASLALALPTAALCLRIGGMLARRAERERAAPLLLLGMFWLGVGTYTGVEALWNLKVLLGVPGLATGLVVLQVKLLASIAGFAGLVGYLVLIYTGRRGWLVPLAAAYFALYVGAVYYYVNRWPVGEHVARWGAQLEYARPGGGLWWNLLVLAWFVPPALASLAYASLLRHLEAPEQRYRLVVVSFGFLVFFLPAPFGWITGSWEWWGLVEKSLALCSTLVFLAAFSPPAFARRRFGAKPLLDEERAWRLRQPRPTHASLDDVLMRAKDLI